MEYQNNNGNYDNRNRRKSKKKKRVYYKAVCIVLCLLIAVAALGIVNLVRSGKESPIPEKKVTQNNESFSFGPASTAKMITALTVLDYCSPDDEMRVGAEIEMMHDDSSRAWLMKGDTLTVRQLLIALMLPSGNDAAYTLAVNTGKKITGDNGLSNAQSIDVFMDKVNQKAKSLGAENSNFVVPDGYDADGQH